MASTTEPNLKSCLGEFEKLYKNRIADLQKEVIEQTEAARNYQTEAVLFKNKYEFCHQSYDAIVNVKKLELCNLSDEVKYWQAQSTPAPVGVNPTHEHLLTLREEQLKRLAGELEMINATLDRYQRKLEEVEAREADTNKQNLALLKTISQDRREKYQLRRALTSERKFKSAAGIISLPLNAFLSKGQSDKQCVIDLLMAVHQDLLGTFSEDEQATNADGSAA